MPRLGALSRGDKGDEMSRLDLASDLFGWSSPVRSEYQDWLEAKAETVRNSLDWSQTWVACTHDDREDHWHIDR